jgi:hypothetical protein
LYSPISVPQTGEGEVDDALPYSPAIQTLLALDPSTPMPL